MSEKKGPFDFTIWTIRKAREKLRIDDTCPICDMDAAIRILEVAGKVDIRSAQFFIDGAANFGEGLSVINSDSSRCLYQTGEKQIRALLESLPGKEEK